MTDTEIYSKSVEGIQLRIVDAEGKRTLWFDEVAQSRMDLSKPNQLITAYEQAMAAWQLFAPYLTQADEVLVLGLGGGSAVKHLHQQFEQPRITVVESSEAVTFAAYAHFALPKVDNIVVNIDDAFSWLAQERGQAKKYRLLMIDLFNTQTQSIYQYSEQFAADCLALMQEDSVCVFNLWAVDESLLKGVLHTLGLVFNWRFLVLPVQDSRNVILFVFHPNGRPYLRSDLEQCAQAVAALTALPMSEYLAHLIQHNHAQLNRCILTD